MDVYYRLGTSLPTTGEIEALVAGAIATVMTVLVIALLGER